MLIVNLLINYILTDPLSKELYFLLIEMAIMFCVGWFIMNCYDVNDEDYFNNSVQSVNVNVICKATYSYEVRFACIT